MSVPAQPLTDGTVSVRPLEPRDSDAFVAGSKDQQVRRFGHLPALLPDPVRLLSSAMR